MKRNKVMGVSITVVDDQKVVLNLFDIEHHLSHCKSCFSRAQMERELNQRIKESGKSEIPTTLKSRLNKLMEEL